MKKGQRKYKAWLTTGFPMWLQARMEERGWNAARLATEVGSSSPLVSKWMQGAQPGPASLDAIADAFELPRIEVYTAAGHLTPDGEQADDPRTLEILERIKHMEMTQERYSMLNQLLKMMATIEPPADRPEGNRGNRTPA